MTKLLNYRKILLSAVMIAFAASLVFVGTQAFFSDTETSTGNTFSAGAIDLQVDSQAHYAGLYCDDGVWVEEVAEQSTRPDLIGEECVGTWTMTDLGPTNTFFNLGDLKPGDEGENTISLHVDNNDAYVCAVINNLQDNDNGLTEPEEDFGDTTGGDGEGELSGEINFFAWEDDGDNVWEDGELPLFADPYYGPASDVLGGVTYPLYTPDTGALEGDTTTYVGLAWCYGDMVVDLGNETLMCDGGPVTNETQTDSMTADISFYVEQSRNNENFVCPGPEEINPDNNNEEVAVGAVLGAYSAPDAESCSYTVVASGEDNVSTFASLQDAVDAASDEDTICVDTGTYPGDTTVDHDLTILGLHDPKGVDRATIDGRIDIDVDGVTISGLEITNPDAGYGIVIDGVNSTEISFNSFTTIGTTILGSAQAIYYDGGAGAASGLSIHDNMIDTVGHAGLEPGGGGGTSAKGIFIGDSTSPDALSGVVIEDNMISNIVASSDAFVDGGRGAYGILINYGVGSTGTVPGAIVRNNTIETLAGWWAHAVGLETDTAGALVTLNAISDVTGASGDSVGVFFEGNPNSDVAVNFNNFAPSVPFGVALHVGNPAITVDAEDNWWGDLDPSDNVVESSGSIDYDPFEVTAFPEN